MATENNSIASSAQIQAYLPRRQTGNLNHTVLFRAELLVFTNQQLKPQTGNATEQKQMIQVINLNLEQGQGIVPTVPILETVEIITLERDL